MAATNLKSFYGLGKQFVKQIQSDLLSPSLVITIRRRAVHSSIYEKNFEDNVCPCIVPENSIAYENSEEYWAPHPQTGIFGPPNKGGLQSRLSVDKAAVSVLEQKVFFRPLELLDKPVD